MDWTFRLGTLQACTRQPASSSLPIVGTSSEWFRTFWTSNGLLPGAAWEFYWFSQPNVLPKQGGARDFVHCTPSSCRGKSENRIAVGQNVLLCAANLGLVYSRSFRRQTRLSLFALVSYVVCRALLDRLRGLQEHPFAMLVASGECATLLCTQNDQHKTIAQKPGTAAQRLEG